MLKVGVIGALGKMGQETIKAVSNEDEMKVVAALDVVKTGEEIKIGENSYKISDSIEKASKNVDVFIDFTGPKSVKENAKQIIGLGKNLIIGATGILEAEINELRVLALENKVNVMIIPNFAIGAVLMMEFSKRAAKYFNEVEILEYHHPYKLDAPSGTAIKTAKLIQETKESREKLKGKEIIEGARGANVGDINIHSIRLNGFVASQEVIFGGAGQTLKIRHDSINRESFMPGVILALKNINEIEGVIYGMEAIL
ncbi:4-hydroxy-tetrahydrodipicolinate reductase [Haliovirga abyssi]|uniref:4-hydroxy-tetrahydrodipicolinate reductase n=1 Tax=Haliovirga abyssi TaxID=2996794 RepID=A0AAU9DX45_9FUSO|nr:4-hydroxy-tetrahydrodipicolinate reductase [Haliovirga abyssi]BDU49895.1 4-hydroxy-tetrahydrodipicolinate reductase [Haliovirga abyssi]